MRYLCIKNLHMTFFIRFTRNFLPFCSFYLFWRFYNWHSTLTWFITANTAFHHCTFFASLHIKSNPALGLSHSQENWNPNWGLLIHSWEEKTRKKMFQSNISKGTKTRKATSPASTRKNLLGPYRRTNTLSRTVYRPNVDIFFYWEHLDDSKSTHFRDIAYIVLIKFYRK